ncbi:MAG: hypothetical protein JKY96_07955 [Phycisphaerales bacterium]|nr:hypothetical protein [Phycisphaerales bacterium]
MKTILKICAVLFVLFVILVIGGIFLVASNLDKMVKTGIEKGGTYATGVQTTVDSVDVGLFSGSLSMQALKIDNPSGFSTPHFMTLASSDTQINLATLNEAKVRISKVRLTGIDLYLDKGNDPSNYNAILNNLKRFEDGDTKQSSDDTGANKPVVIESLVLEDISIHVANMPGISLLTGDIAITIPKIELENIGENENMTVGEIVGLVVKTVLSAAIESGGGIFPDDVLNDLIGGLGDLSSLSDLGIGAISGLGDGILDGATEQAQQTIDGIKEQGEKAVEDIKDQLDDTVKDAVDDVQNEIEKGLGNLFGNKKDD